MITSKPDSENTQLPSIQEINNAACKKHPCMEDSKAQTVLKQAAYYLKNGQTLKARHYAIKAALMAPQSEMAWLILAAVVDPQASLTYLRQALTINPQSQRARQGIDWALKRLRSENKFFEEQENTITPAASSSDDDKESAAPKSANIRRSLLGILLKRISNAILIFLAIAFLTLTGIFLAEQGKQGTPVSFFMVLQEGIRRTFSYFIHHPSTYYWHKENVPSIKVVGELFLNSAGLLLTSLLVASTLGILFGLAAALTRRKKIAPVILLTSVLGISTPSFLMAILLQMINVKAYQWLNLSKAIFPPHGFGWGKHLVLPALVLSARPLAQIMQVTYLTLSQALEEDYVRTARSKGAGLSRVLFKHTFRNTLIPILNTLSASLRFSLASLPVVESFFLWPGIGMTILDALTKGNPSLVTDLILSLGALFLLVNLALEILFPLINPKLREQNGAGADELTFSNQGEGWKYFKDNLSLWWQDLKTQTGLFFHKNTRAERKNMHSLPDQEPLKPSPLAAPEFEDQSAPSDRTFRRHILRTALRNIPLIFGTIMFLGLIFLVIYGEKLSPNNPYETHGIMMIEGTVYAPPFEPSSTFPWGSDLLGRDIQSLVFSGAKLTLALALFATMARLVLGVVIGLVAGWWQNSRVDRFINSISSIWAAIPVTIFTMLLVLALGIEQGISIFVIGLSVVGWGEIAQYVRGQVIQEKPRLYIEASRSVGARPGQILRSHILPHLVPSMFVLAVMEMGSVLMLLAELGFLNIFLGGGFKVQLGEFATSFTYFFSDVPEWGALLANIRLWWRSYPWLATYPGIFFFFSILTFNLWGEGLRRFIEESKINLSRLINRYSLLLAAGFLLLTGWALRSSAPINVYKSQARQFNEQNVLEDIRVLSSPEFQGRESSTGNDKLAADYIAAQMKEIGLIPAGENQTYFQEMSASHYHLASVPRLEVVTSQGQTRETFTYREDFTEYISYDLTMGTGQGPMVGLIVSANSSELQETPLIIRDFDLEDKIILIRETDLQLVDIKLAAGILVVMEENDFLQEKDLYPPDIPYHREKLPTLKITRETANTLLLSANSSLEQLGAKAATLTENSYATTQPGDSLLIEVEVEEIDLSKRFYNVIGIYPGTGAAMGPQGEALDNQVIIVSAYYDGLGVGPDGTLYPSANDNASGAAAMLEMARVLKQGSYEPKKTVIFTAWVGGERNQSLSVTNIMNAHYAFDQLNVEAVLELSGMGGGTGNAIYLDKGSSFRLVSLFQDAASRMGTSVTARGKGPHVNRPAKEAYGGRTAITAYVSWDGSDRYAHTPEDTFENIDPEILKKTGQTTMLVLNVLSRETAY